MTRSEKFLALSCLILASTSSWAVDELDQIQAERAQLQVDYFHQLRTNPKMTTAEKRDLYQRMMSRPAEKIRAMHERGRTEREKRLKDQERTLAAAGVNSSGYQIVSPGSQPAAKAPIADPHGLARPQFILDGSSIPKEVDFPGIKNRR